MNYRKISGKSIRRVRHSLCMTQPKFAKWLSKRVGIFISTQMLCRMENFAERDACNPLEPFPSVVEVIYDCLEELDHAEKNKNDLKVPTNPLGGSMKRHYYIRNYLREVEQIDGVIAVQTSSDSRAQITSRISKEQLLVNEEELEIFENAGWIFIKESTSSERSTDLLQEVSAIGTVFRRHEDGALLIGTNALTVKLKPELSETDVTDKFQREGLTVVRQFKFAPNLFEVNVSTETDPLDLANKLHEEKEFIYAEPIMVECIQQRNPSDPEYEHQWQWKNNGINGAVPNADIRAEIAWQHANGAGVRIAIIDNGFDTNHEDLVGGIVSESGYFSRNKDFVQGLNNYPNSDHGTFCAGIAGARANNGFGGRGIAFESKLLVVACLQDQVGEQETLARAIAYAADPSTEVDGADPSLGADVISCSLGPSGFLGGRRCIWEMKSILEDAINFAANNGRKGLGAPIFWATSNAQVPISDDQVCSHPLVIAVGRSNSSDMADGSAYGEELDFLVPGADVYSTLPGNRYGRRTGTSFATPIAAGVAALLLNINSDLTSIRVREIMCDTCDQIGGVSYNSNHNKYYGFGRINATRAINAILPPSETSLSTLSLCYVSVFIMCSTVLSTG